MEKPQINLDLSQFKTGNTLLDRVLQKTRKSYESGSLTKPYTFNTYTYVRKNKGRVSDTYSSWELIVKFLYKKDRETRRTLKSSGGYAIVTLFEDSSNTYEESVILEITSKQINSETRMSLCSFDVELKHSYYNEKGTTSESHTLGERTLTLVEQLERRLSEATQKVKARFKKGDRVVLTPAGVREKGRIYLSSTFRVKDVYLGRDDYPAFDASYDSALYLLQDETVPGEQGVHRIYGWMLKKVSDSYNPYHKSVSEELDYSQIDRVPVSSLKVGDSILDKDGLEQKILAISPVGRGRYSITTNYAEREFSYRVRDTTRTKQGRTLIHKIRDVPSRNESKNSPLAQKLLKKEKTLTKMGFSSDEQQVF